MYSNSVTTRLRMFRLDLFPNGLPSQLVRVTGDPSQLRFLRRGVADVVNAKGYSYPQIPVGVGDGNAVIVFHVELLSH